jgi:hypothetical protein
MVTNRSGEIKPGTFATHAPQLADWSLAHLVNRTDVYGSYHANGIPTTCYAPINRARLIQHFQAGGPCDVLGVHSADAANRGRWGGLDFDVHGDDPARAEANRLAALHWYGVLMRQGFRPLLYESNGRGGYHLRVLLAEPVPAERLFHFVRRLVADHRQHRLAQPPEAFPKQADVRRCAKRLGNWLRLPGRHPKRDFWSRVWDGSSWLAGSDAAQFMLTLRGDSPALVPAVPPPAPKPSPPRRTCHHGLAGTAAGAATAGGNLPARIAAYLRRLPNLGEGEGRDDIAFKFAAFLVRDLGLADSTALAWLERWDAGNRPPKGKERLAEIVQAAHDYGQHAIGSGLPPEQPRYDRHGHRILRVTGEVS